MLSPGVIIKNIHHIPEHINCFRGMSKMHEPVHMCKQSVLNAGSLRDLTH